MSDWMSRAVEVPAAPAGGSVPAPTSDWMSRAVPVAQEPVPPISKTESALRGGAQGMTMGFGDELSGLGGALGTLMGSHADTIQSTHPDVQAKINAMAMESPSFADAYRAARDEARTKNAAAQKAHPGIYGGASFAGGMAPALLTGGATAAARIGGGAALGAGMAAGNSDADLTEGDVGGLAKDTAIGAGVGGATAAVAPMVTQGIKSGIQKVAGAISSPLSDTAESLAVKATGATRAQAEKFVPDTGRELLDRGIVKFGNDPAAIAESAQSAMDAAQASKQELLNGPLASAKVDRQGIVNFLRSKVAEFKGDESKVDLVRALEAKINDIEAQIPEPTQQAVGFQPGDKPVELSPGKYENDAYFNDPSKPKPARYIFGSNEDQWAKLRGKQLEPPVSYTPITPKMGEVPGDSAVPLPKSEEIRRGFDNLAKWDSNTDAPTRDAAKITAGAYRDAGETAASATDPELGAQFKADKRTQHVLIPVQEAAEKRALQLQQSPHGGLLDAAWTGGGSAAGATLGGPVGAAVGAVVGNTIKTLRPRYASMGAVTTDWLAKSVAATPSAFGKYAAPLMNASARGPMALAATHYVLQQTDPEYREKIDQFRGPAERSDQ